jgi:hypothetical protein
MPGAIDHPARSGQSYNRGAVRQLADVCTSGLAYGPRMTQVDPLRSSRNDSTQLFCATCGHSEAVHSNSGDRRCLRSVCSCHRFIVGIGLDLTAQVLSS